MRHPVKILALLGISLISLLAARPVLAFPPLPSSFYGIVKVNGANVPDGTPVEALIDGQVLVKGLTQSYQGDSVYTLDIPGDQTDTAVLEGGRDGDTIQFKIGGVLADQTGTWRSGTNVQLDLSAASTATLTAPENTATPRPTQTATSAATLLPLQDTPTPKPTQTATSTATQMPLQDAPTPRPTQTAISAATLLPLQDTPTPIPTQAALTSGDQASATATTKARSTPTTALMQPRSTIASDTNQENNPANTGQVIAFIVIFVGLIIVTILWWFFFLKPKMK
jgi:hypothetical protein